MQIRHAYFLSLKRQLFTGWLVVSRCLYAWLLMHIGICVSAQEVFPLYKSEIPGARPTQKQEIKSSGMFRSITQPALELFQPDKNKANGTAIIICPGGGYSVIVYDGEGVNTAKQFTEKGITVFVLKYRLPDDSIMQDKTIGPLQDIQQAIKLVRENAAKWGIDPSKIGIAGFSAGGHLASTAATHYNNSVINNPENTSLRPDFQILVYPVISMQEDLTHKDSRKKLLGDSPSKQTVDYFSNELMVTEKTAPAYITHASDDKVVTVNNSIRYYEALQSKKVPVEMHLYQKGDHGFIFRMKEWTEPLFTWMKANRWIN
jgi:acetyl esterase/lipase